MGSSQKRIMIPPGKEDRPKSRQAFDVAAARTSQLVNLFNWLLKCARNRLLINRRSSLSPPNQAKQLLGLGSKLYAGNMQRKKRETKRQKILPSTKNPSTSFKTTQLLRKTFKKNSVIASFSKTCHTLIVTSMKG